MLQSAQKVLAISAEQGFPNWSAAGNVMRGWCLGVTGQAAEGIELLLKGIADVDATAGNTLRPFFLMALAEVYGTVAEPKEGLNRLVEAAKLVETTHERWAEAEMHRCCAASKRQIPGASRRYEPRSPLARSRQTR
jgi:predicted ATPase